MCPSRGLSPQLSPSLRGPRAPLLSFPHGPFMGFSGEPPGQSSDFFTGAFVQPPVSLGSPCCFPATLGPCPSCSCPSDLRIPFVLILLLPRPPPPPPKIPLLRRSRVQMLISTLVSRGPTFLGLAVRAAGGHSSAWGRPHVTNSGSGPFQPQKRAGRPGTLWFEPFALWVSWLFLPGSSSWPRVCAAVLKAQVSPGRRESGKGAGSRGLPQP